AVMSRAADPIVADAVLQAGLVGVLPYVLRAVIGETLQRWQLAGSEPLGLQDQGPGQGFATEQVDARIGLPGLTQAQGGCRDPGHAGRVAVGYRPGLQANAWRAYLHQLAGARGEAFAAGRLQDRRAEQLRGDIQLPALLGKDRVAHLDDAVAHAVHRLLE